MSYVDNSMIPGEQVAFRTRLHPITLVLPVLLILICLRGAFIFGGLYSSWAMLAIIYGVLKYFNFATSEFAVTNKRVIIKVGILRRRTLELQLSKVEAVAVDQGILGRMLGYGNIVVTGTGGSKEPFKTIRGPLEFRRAVQTQSP
jgi:uncharacterized membrane protein YdbT with pleckstrin-like domain